MILRRCVVAMLTGSMLALAAAAAEPGADSGAQCAAKAITPISSGFGADGPFAVEQVMVAHTGYRQELPVFLPKGDGAARYPVIFFSHGYGPNIWSVYEPLLRHMASRGAIVVFGVFPMGMVTMRERYEILWNGYLAATQRLAERMDLTRVGFVGHSFGGGANPTLAYQGIVQKGWGSKGAFMFELAPWYTFGMSDEKLRSFPPHVLHAVQVYDRDRMNDHRMAFDLQRQMRTPVNWALLVRSETVRGCALTAEHMLPARSKNLILEQYALFRPLDVLMQAAFERGDPGALAGALKPSPEGYQPLQILEQPQAPQPGSEYRFAWDGRMNPRKEGDASARGQFSDLSDAQDLPLGDAAAAPRKGLLERWRERRAPGAATP